MLNIYRSPKNDDQLKAVVRDYEIGSKSLCFATIFSTENPAPASAKKNASIAAKKMVRPNFRVRSVIKKIYSLTKQLVELINCQEGFGKSQFEQWIKLQF